MSTNRIVERGARDFVLAAVAAVSNVSGEVLVVRRIYDENSE